MQADNAETILKDRLIDVGAQFKGSFPSAREVPQIFCAYIPNRLFFHCVVGTTHLPLLLLIPHWVCWYHFSFRDHRPHVLEHRSLISIRGKRQYLSPYRMFTCAVHCYKLLFLTRPDCASTAQN